MQTMKQLVAYPHTLVTQVISSVDCAPKKVKLKRVASLKQFWSTWTDVLYFETPGSYVWPCTFDTHRLLQQTASQGQSIYDIGNVYCFHLQPNSYQWFPETCTAKLYAVGSPVDKGDCTVRR
jgi:hypothetical protein